MGQALPSESIIRRVSQDLDPADVPSWARLNISDTGCLSKQTSHQLRKSNVRLTQWVRSTAETRLRLLLFRVDEIDRRG